MTEYLSTSSFESKLVPGLVYQLRKMSTGRRMQLTHLSADVQTRIDEQMERVEPINQEIKDLEYTEEQIPEELKQKRDKIQMEVWNNLTVAELYPIFIKWGVISYSGITFDGKDTVDALIEVAPDDLIVEVGIAIQKLTRMTFDEQMGFKSLGTSTTQVTEPKKDTSVDTVRRIDSTKKEYVDDSSPIELETLRRHGSRSTSSKLETVNNT